MKFKLFNKTNQKNKSWDWNTLDRNTLGELRDIPNEILLEIISHLNLREKATSLQVCKILNILTQRDPTFIEAIKKQQSPNKLEKKTNLTSANFLTNLAINYLHAHSMRGAQRVLMETRFETFESFRARF